MAGQRRRCGRGYGGQVDQSIGIAHAALEVAVGGGDAGFAVAQHALVQSQAGRTAGREYQSPGLDDGVGVAGLVGLEHDGAGGGTDQQAHALLDLLALEYGCGLGNILEPAVGAGADEGLVDPDVFKLSGERGVIHGVGLGDGRLQLRNINVDGALVDSIVVGLDGLVLIAAPLLLQIVLRDLVGGEEADLGPGLDGHVGDGEALRHGHPIDGLAAELKGPVGGAVGADPADQAEDEVLGAHPSGEFAGNADAEGLRNTQPGLAQRPGHGDVAGAHARGEGAEAAGCDGMGVGPHDDLTRTGQVLGDYLVANAVTHVGEDAAGLGGEFAQEDVIVGQRMVGAGRGMVDEDGGAGRIGQGALVALVELAHGERAGGVLDEDEVDRTDDNLTCFSFDARPGAENLFA